MENKKVSVWKGTLNAGIILGLVLILYSLILYFLDQTFNKGLGYVSILIFIIGLYFGIVDFRKKARGGYMSYGQVLGAGVVISLYAYILTGIFVFVLYKYIDPDLSRKLISFTQDKLAARGLTDEQIEMSMKISSKFMSPVIMGLSSVFNGVFFGTIISLILGIFLKREKSPNELHAEEVEGQ